MQKYEAVINEFITLRASTFVTRLGEFHAIIEIVNSKEGDTEEIYSVKDEYELRDTLDLLEKSSTNDHELAMTRHVLWCVFDEFGIEGMGEFTSAEEEKEAERHYREHREPHCRLCERGKKVHDKV